MSMVLSLSRFSEETVTPRTTFLLPLRQFGQRVESWRGEDRPRWQTQAKRPREYGQQQPVFSVSLTALKMGTSRGTTWTRS